MLSRRILFVALLIGSFNVSPAFAQLPADQTVQWRFHQTPSTPSSPVDFRVIATLKAVEMNRDEVGWEVQRLEFFQVLANGTKTWVENYPGLGTPDGLWWATHANPLAPNLDEFLSSPLLKGVATADNPADDDLTYSLESSPATIGVYPHTASVTYALAPQDPVEPPIKSGDNEPVEADDTREAS